MPRYRTVHLNPEIAARIEQVAKADDRTLATYIHRQLDPRRTQQ